MSPSLLVVGDIHRHWRPEDALYLERGDQDMVLFVGDFGDEDVSMVRAVSQVGYPRRSSWATTMRGGASARST